jgi:hypothetical protein
MDSLATTMKRFSAVVIFSMAFGYIEAAVVVYLRRIFHPEGFTFPLISFMIGSVNQKILLTEVGREASTLVIILTSAWLFGKNLQQRVAYFLTIFAVWDIFYYIWIKVLLNWPESIMDWDILFLIPISWAGPVLAPVLVSVVMLIFAGIILYQDSLARPIRTYFFDRVAFFLAALIIVVSFCIPGPHIAQENYRGFFYWPLFFAGLLFAVLVFVKCLVKSGQK